ncbi:transposase [Salmonella enterica subsp. enterica serovar Typhimurium]|nr:transposase [Salmonella enterica subsp. enterica serovar Typhimurium]
MYDQKSIPSDTLLRWSKLLEYDFFRIYSQHLIMYSPSPKRHSSRKKTNLPKFRKNIYTEEIIEFIIELINNGTKTTHQVIEEYEIPKTTLYNWLKKYKNGKTTQL